MDKIMNINLQQRALLMKLLPKTGSIADQLICKEITDKLMFISDEHKEKISFKDIGNGNFSYESTKDEPMEFIWSESEKHVLKRGVDALDKSEEVTPEILDMCLKVRDL